MKVHMISEKLFCSSSWWSQNSRSFLKTPAWKIIKVWVLSLWFYNFNTFLCLNELALNVTLYLNNHLFGVWKTIQLPFLVLHCKSSPPLFYIIVCIQGIFWGCICAHMFFDWIILRTSYLTYMSDKSILGAKGLSSKPHSI